MSLFRQWVAPVVPVVLAWRVADPTVLPAEHGHIGDAAVEEVVVDVEDLEVKIAERVGYRAREPVVEELQGVQVGEVADALGNGAVDGVRLVRPKVIPTH